MGKLLGIAIRKASRAPMVQIERGVVNRESGILGDFRGGGGRNRKRQVTVISKERWADVENDLGDDIPWTTRRANLLVEGIDFSKELVGKHLRIGSDIILEITGETTPCKRMDEARDGLQEALKPDWRGGITCRVFTGGSIAKGDTVTLLESKPLDQSSLTCHAKASEVTTMKRRLQSLKKELKTAKVKERDKIVKQFIEEMEDLLDKHEERVEELIRSQVKYALMSQPD